MRMTTIVKAADAAQFLSYVPHLLNFHPSQSLVLIPFDGGRSLGAMRFDLPGENDDGAGDTIDRVASTVLGMVCRVADANAFAAVIYTDETFASHAGMPQSALLGAIERRADSCGLRITDMLCVAADAWGSRMDPLCPQEGRPLEELKQEADAAPGPAPIGDHTAGATLPEVDLAESERAGRALQALSRVFTALSGAQPDDVPGAEVDDDGDVRVNPQAIAAAYSLDDIPALFEQALTWPLDDIGAYDAALIGWCLARPSVRDVALVQWSGSFDDGDDALDAQMRWESGEEYPVHLAMRMWGEGLQPEPKRLVAALEMVRHVAALMPADVRAGSLAMCAWLSWALGRSTHADIYARMACEIDPEHGLSEIVLSFVTAGHLPEFLWSK